MAQLKTAASATDPFVFVSVRVGQKLAEQIAIPAPRLDAIADAIHRSLAALTLLSGDSLSSEFVQRRLLRICLAPPPGETSAIGSLGLWLAFHHPNGGYREGVAGAIRRHGEAHITVQTDRLGRAWGFAVSGRPVNLTPFLIEALAGSGGVSVRTPMDTCMN